MGKEYINFSVKFQPGKWDDVWNEQDMMQDVHSCILVGDDYKYHPKVASLIEWYFEKNNSGWTIMHYAFFIEITADELQDKINYGLDQIAIKDNYEYGEPPKVFVINEGRVE